MEQINILILCPKSWKMLVLLTQHKIQYKEIIETFNTKLKFPLINNLSELSYIFLNEEKFFKTKKIKEDYGMWLNLIYADFIPNIVDPIKNERVFKPINKRIFPDVNFLNNKRKELREYLINFNKILNLNMFLSSDFSIIDIMLISSLLVLEYLGEFLIKENDLELENLYRWFIRIKSRIEFQSVLKQRCFGINPHANFLKLDY